MIEERDEKWGLAPGWGGLPPCIPQGKGQVRKWSTPPDPRIRLEPDFALYSSLQGGMQKPTREKRAGALAAGEKDKSEK